MDTYFFLWVVTQYPLFLSQQFSSFGFWGSFRLTSVSFGHMSKSFISVLVLKDTPALCCSFVLGLESVIFPFLKLPDFFLNIYFKNQELNTN